MVNSKLKNSGIEERETFHKYITSDPLGKNIKSFSTQRKTVRNPLNPLQYQILTTVVVVIILSVNASLETKKCSQYGRLGENRTCCKSKKWNGNKKYVNKVNTLGKFHKRNKKNSKISNETPLKKIFIFVTMNDIQINYNYMQGST